MNTKTCEQYNSKLHARLRVSSIIVVMWCIFVSFLCVYTQKRNVVGILFNSEIDYLENNNMYTSLLEEEFELASKDKKINEKVMTRIMFTHLYAKEVNWHIPNVNPKSFQIFVYTVQIASTHMHAKDCV